MKSAYDAMRGRSLSLLLAAVLLCVGVVVARVQDPSPEPAATLRGITLYQQGDIKRAVEALEEAVRVDPTDADAWHYLGLALLHEGKSVEASEAFGEAVKWRFQRFAWVRPSDSRRGDLSVHLDERFAEAVQSLEEYLRLKPKAEPVWRGRLEAARFYARFYKKREVKKRVAYSSAEVQCKGDHGGVPARRSITISIVKGYAVALAANLSGGGM